MAFVLSAGGDYKEVLPYRTVERYTRGPRASLQYPSYGGGYSL